MKLELLIVSLLVCIVSLGQNESTNLESFELSLLPECWSLIDEDEDGYNWDVSYQVLDENGITVSGNTGVGYLTSASFDNSEGVLTPDNYLVLPQLNIQPNEDLSFYIGAVDPSYFLENYSVLLSSTGNNPEDFTDTLLTEVLAAHIFQFREIDLSDYEGMEVYIAFNHHNSSNQFQIRLDDVLYPTTLEECEILVSLAEIGNELVELNIFPNPSQGIFTLENSHSGIEEIVVFGTTGIQVWNQKYAGKSQSQSVDLSDLAQGVYTVMVKAGQYTASKRVIIN
ncbi:MAG TPA: T9SS C-terminal target domain-containing protein [Flavobacteriales bacterium]|nr:T9SS C-terminal target domain-containing protein [Flavobacteriales bacterium]|tara:strand:- start:29196 stop:30044 length:849 start_codon:yes stop_codon:yes gene_type:complete